MQLRRGTALVVYLMASFVPADSGQCLFSGRVSLALDSLSTSIGSQVLLSQIRFMSQISVYVPE